MMPRSASRSADAGGTWGRFLTRFPLPQSATAFARDWSRRGRGGAGSRSGSGPRLSAAGVDAALELAEQLEDLLVREGQELREDHASNVERRVEPEIGIGEPRPGEAAGVGVPPRSSSCS
jgi:hypothetical protein